MRTPRAERLQVLGPVEVWRDGELVGVPGAKPKAVLTMLGLYARRFVSDQLLLEILWGDDAPRTARRAIQTHVSVLRSVLGDEAVLTRGNGWLFAGDDVDAHEFETTAHDGREMLRNGQALEASALLSRSLDLWRSPPVLPDTIRADAEVRHWRETRESVVDDWFDARLANGESAMLVGKLESNLADDPLRERRWGQLCLALYRSGRQGDALAAYQRARSTLVEQLGIEPGTELKRLEAAILSQDAALEVAEPTTAEIRGRRAATDATLSASGPPGVHVQTKHGALPTPLTSFVGRERELRELTGLVSQHRQVTVVGPAGVGKTRLTLATADLAGPDYAEHSWFVDLATTSPDAVAATVAAAIGATELADRSIEAAITAHIGVHRSLLLLDSCDHLLTPVSELVRELIARCPGVVALVTSRQPLGTAGEHVYHVPPMSAGTDAVALFIERATAVDPGLTIDRALAAEVCARCDDLPLAIELAAVRCTSLGIDGLVAGLDDHLRLLVSDRAATERHNSIRAVLDWSHDYLDSDEQRFFNRLSVFAGSFDADGAAAVCLEFSTTEVLDVLGRLTEKNLLVHVTSGSGGRWRMLDLVRAYAREHLASSADAGPTRQRYLYWATDMATALERRLATGQPWRDELAAVAADLWAAHRTPATQWPDDADRLALALALARLQARAGAFTLAEHAYDDAMVIARSTREPDRLADAALGASEPGMLFGVMHSKRVALLKESLAAVGDEVTCTKVKLLARLATELYWSNESDNSRVLANSAVAGAAHLEDDAALAHALYAKYYVTRGPGTVADRLMLAERITRSARRAGETQLDLAGLAAHAVTVLESGDIAVWEADIAELAEASDRLGHPEFQWYVAVYRLVQALITGRYDEATTLAASATAAAKHAPEFSVGLRFAEAISDLREHDAPSARRHAARMHEMAGRFPRILVWRCLGLLADVKCDRSMTVHHEMSELCAELLTGDVRDGHWLVACCLLGEAVAHVGDEELAVQLSDALRPFESDLAIAGRVAAFRGSVAHPLGLLADLLGEHDQSRHDLEFAAEKHRRLGTEPFYKRSLEALDRLTARH